MTTGVSLNDVARAAGVAPSTVSRFLAGHLNLAPKTEERVRAAIKTLGYEPKQNKESVASKTIAIVVPRVTNPYFSQLCDQVVAAAAGHGYSTAIISARDLDIAGTESLKLLLSGAILGVIYAGTHRKHHGIGKLISAGLPVVALAEPVPGCDIDVVRADDYSGALQAVTYLTRLGHRNVALIAGPKWLASNQDALKGYTDALAQSGIDPNTQIQLFGELTVEFGVSALSRVLLARENRPSAVFVYADEIALGVYLAAKDLGVRIPEELSVVSSDDIPMASYLTPALTSVRAPSERMAARAVDILLGRIAEGSAEEPLNVMLPVSLNVRESAISPAN